MPKRKRKLAIQHNNEECKKMRNSLNPEFMLPERGDLSFFFEKIKVKEKQYHNHSNSMGIETETIFNINLEEESKPLVNLKKIKQSTL